jgi:hypothetical protein
MFTFPGTVMGSTAYPASPYPNLLYNNSGIQDTNGLFYYCGTALGTTSWSNPSTNGTVNLFANATPATGTLANLVDRDVSSTTQCISSNTASSYFAFEIIGKYFIILGFLLRNRSAASGYLRNWEIQGSALDFASTSTWSTIQAYSSNTTLNSSNQFAYFSIPSPTTTKYRTLRLIQTGNNNAGTSVLALSEIEFYGYLYNTL